MVALLALVLVLNVGEWAAIAQQSAHPDLQRPALPAHTADNRDALEPLPLEPMPLEHSASERSASEYNDSDHGYLKLNAHMTRYRLTRARLSVIHQANL